MTRTTNYVARRILVTSSDGSTSARTEAEFLENEQPLVLLGEPGAGKSETAQALATLGGGPLIYAEQLVGEGPIPDLGSFVVVDGLDEVLAAGTRDPVGLVVGRLLTEGVEHFVLTCRAADWQHAAAVVKLDRRLHTEPIIGKLAPLNGDEIVAFVGAFRGADGSGEQFLRQVRERNAEELASNPQTLRLLLDAVARDGWPGSRTELFESACKQMAEEPNRLHASLDRSRPSLDAILDGAGAVFSKLLLSGNRGVAVDGVASEYFPAASEFGAAETPAVATAIKSRLFRPSKEGCVEPIHRTVAEFLSARWLARKTLGEVSQRRLETLLYAPGSRTVPSSLRGLHAWLAALSPSMSGELIKADPYGVLRYGDADRLSDGAIRQLIASLRDFSEKDPYFRNEDWHADMGRALARDAAESDIVGLLADKSAPYLLTTVVLESLKGTPLAIRILSDLQKLCLDETESYVERMRAGEALAASGDRILLRNTVESLTRRGTAASSRLALELIAEEPKVADGTLVGDALVGFERASGSRRIAGVAHGLAGLLSSPDLGIVVRRLGSAVRRNDNSRPERDLRERLFEYLEAFLKAGGTATAEELWQWLRNAAGQDYSGKRWDEFSSNYFGDRPALRQEVQAVALADSSTDGDVWSTLFELPRIAAGLRLTEEDFAYHLRALLARDPLPHDYVARWMGLFQAVLVNGDFSGQAEAVARSQAADRAELADEVYKLEHRPRPGWEAEHEAYEERRARTKLAQQKGRAKSFTAIRESVASGKHLGALNDIAHVYLGWVNDYDGAPLDRLRQYVGEPNLDAALAGLRSVSSRSDLPTVRKAAELRAKEKKHYFLEKVAIGTCALHLAEGGDLAALPMPLLKIALAGHEWGLYRSSGEDDGRLENDLRRLVFEDAPRREQFLRDSIEPHLSTDEPSISGLYQVTHDDEFRDISGRLALEWMKRFPHVGPESLGHLMEAALMQSDRRELEELVAQRIKQRKWGNDKVKEVWFGAAYALNFARFRAWLEPYAKGSRDHLWPLLRFATAETSDPSAVERLVFITRTFAPSFQLVELPSSGWGGRSPYEGSQQIVGTLRQLSTIATASARDALQELIAMPLLGNHLDGAKHLLAQQERLLAEQSWDARSLDDVNKVLDSGRPISIDDLQSLVLDELHLLQRRIQDGTTNGVDPYWNGEKPHGETYCRDRIAEGLDPHLAKYGIRVTAEGTMPDGNRCDILCLHGQLDLPVEIKGQ